MCHLYHNQALNVDHLSNLNPMSLFANWLSEARQEESIICPEAMCLATASADGRPSTRMVVLAGVDDETLQFYTCHESRKGKELSANPYASVVFYWPALHRQVRFDGRVERLSADDSDRDFNSRPMENQLHLIANAQGKAIESREAIEQRFERVCAEMEGVDIIPRPADWGGYRLVPSMIELWQGQDNWRRDRLYFRKRREGEVVDEKLTRTAHGDWVVERLMP